MSIWTDSTSGQWTDTSSGLWTDEEIEGGESLALEDARFDLSAYYQALEDVPLEISAYYQALEDASSELLMIGWGIEDVRSYMHAAVLVLEDTGGYFEAIGRAREDALSLLQAIAWTTFDAATYLAAASATILSDAAVCLEVTDGQAFSNAPTWLAAIRQPPAFRSTVAQRMASIVSAATWTSIEDFGVRLEAASYAAENAGAYLAAVAA